MATSSAALPVRRRLRMPHPRWAVVAAVVLVLLLAIFWFWGRNSSLVAVDDVQISGATGTSAPEIERAIRGAVHGMTTLNFDDAAVQRALAVYPIVASVDVTTSFPHTAKVVVHQRTPVGTILVGGKDVPVSKDGTLLLGTVVKGLPAIASQHAPSGGRITHRDTLAEVRVLAAATAAQRGKITHVGLGAQGVEIQLQGEPIAYFGEAKEPRDQWAALAQVLADPGSEGARYVDVSVPERPAAGGFADPTTVVDDGSGVTDDGITDDGSDDAAAADDGTVTDDGTDDGGYDPSLDDGETG